VDPSGRRQGEARQDQRSGGEPKTQVWYVAEAEPGAAPFVGLRQGATGSVRGTAGILAMSRSGFTGSR
jgi:hypothetical protein